MTGRIGVCLLAGAWGLAGASAFGDWQESLQRAGATPAQIGELTRQLAHMTPKMREATKEYLRTSDSGEILDTWWAWHARFEIGVSPRPIFGDVSPVASIDELRQIALPNATVESASVDAADGSCHVTVAVTHPPSGDRVRIFIALPMKGWNGRFYGTGGSAFSGGGEENLAVPVQKGFAAGATDTGHEGGSASFALDGNGRLNWQAIQDNAYLGIHEMTVVGKALAEAFYGKAPAYSYFVGGSAGGRQAMMEAQRYPEDYDGIIAMCPGIYWPRLLPAMLWPQVVMLETKDFVSKAKFDAVTAAAVAACGSGGVIEDPMHCRYDPRAFVGASVGGSPFTEADAEVVRRIWEGPRAPGGRFLWYGLPRGAELSPLGGVGGSPPKGTPSMAPLYWFRYFLTQDPQWDWTTVNWAGYERLFEQSVEEFGGVLGTDNPDLSRFRARGGKLLMLQGLADQFVPPQSTIGYCEQLEEKIGGAEKTSEFARLFLAPGVDHGFYGAGLTPTGMAGAIIDWVEEGRAPDHLTGKRWNRVGATIQTGPLHPYRRARARGAGN